MLSTQVLLGLTTALKRSLFRDRVPLFITDKLLLSGWSDALSIAGKGGDQTDQFLKELTGLATQYRAPKFWIMLEKEFKDDPDKLVSSVCKFDSATGNLNYCGTICLQMTEEAVLRPTEEFFAMILYNSDPNSKVFLRRCLY